jgi:hypothetical protein
MQQGMKQGDDSSVDSDAGGLAADAGRLGLVETWCMHDYMLGVLEQLAGKQMMLEDTYCGSTSDIGSCCVSFDHQQQESDNSTHTDEPKESHDDLDLLQWKNDHLRGWLNDSMNASRNVQAVTKLLLSHGVAGVVLNCHKNYSTE